jgi:hypothetical protein
VNITGCSFENSSSNSNGGAVYASTGSGGTVSITDCGFEKTSSVLYGGAVSAYASSGTVNINDCDFQNTSCTTGCGGAVYANGANIAISDYTSTKTRAKTGGSVYVSGTSISISDAFISDSQTESFGISYACGGGGIFIGTGTAALTRVTFRDVFAYGDEEIGAAVFFSTGTHLTMTDCSIEHGYCFSVSGFGGVIGGAGSSSCVLERVSFTDCGNPLFPDILYGNKYRTGPDGAPAYTLRSGFSIDGTVITGSNYYPIMVPAMHLFNGSTAVFSP